LAALLQAHPEVQYLRIEDGPGLPLGRSFAVKLWPTFVFLSDGQVMARLVRPSAAELAETVRLLTAARPEDSR
jgi:thioredoxin 1